MSKRNLKAIRSKEFRGRTVVGWQSYDAFERFDWLIDTYEIETIIELGPFVGLSTCYFAELGVKRIYTVDNFDVRSQDYRNYLLPVHEPAADDQYREFLRNTLSYESIVGIKMDFMEAVDVLPEVDMVYIDAVQSYPKFKAVVDAYLPKARKIISGDDAHISQQVVARIARELGGTVIPGARTWWAEVNNAKKK